MGAAEGENSMRGRRRRSSQRKRVKGGDPSSKEEEMHKMRSLIEGEGGGIDLIGGGSIPQKRRAHSHGALFILNFGVNIRGGDHGIPLNIMVENQ